MKSLEGLLDDAQQLQARVIELRRSIHAEPELGLELPATRRKVLEALEGLGLEIRLHEKSSGIVAILRGGRPEGRTLLLRADMDALPMPEDNDLPFRSRNTGAMHACGHDAHTAMLVGAAHLMAERVGRMHGNLVFMFQPGEEGHFGAQRMMDEGVLDDPRVDAAFAIHISPLFPSGRIATRAGPLMASADRVRISVSGRGGHASMPHDAVDPVPVACELVQALQSMVTRRIPAFEPVVLTITQMHAGTTNNVIPEAVQLDGTLRAFSRRSREQAHAGIQRVAEHVAQAHGTEARLQIDRGYDVTANDAEFARFTLDVAGELLGRDAALEMPEPVMGAEDFGYLLQRVPGAMVFLGVAPRGVAEPAPCHSNRMLLDEDGLVFGTALHAAIAARYLEAKTR
jgi:hippurate hydrolase